MKLPRILQLIWMLIGAVSIVQAYFILKSPDPDKTSAYLFMGVTLFAAVRYFMLRRRQFNEKKKNGDFD
jgi:hypothetical protein